MNRRRRMKRRRMKKREMGEADGSEGEGLSGSSEIFAFFDFDQVLVMFWE